MTVKNDIGKGYRPLQEGYKPNLERGYKPQSGYQPNPQPQSPSAKSSNDQIKPPPKKP